MNEAENNKSLKLSNILKKDNWTVKQFYPIENTNNFEVKIIFKNLPGVLIRDFFAPNTINHLSMNKDKVYITSTGIDDVSWKYELDRISED